MTESDVTVAPITAADALATARFFNENLNPKVSTSAWLCLIDPPFSSDVPNRGFQLMQGRRIVGAYAAVYSVREIAGAKVTVGNLAAFCVLEEFRAHSLRLIRPLLRQKGIEFTDLSPSGNVVALNTRLGFSTLDTATTLVANLPALHRRGTLVSCDPMTIESALRGTDAAVYRDHRNAPAARHLVVQRNGEYAYLLYRKDRRKGLQLFATPLYVGGERRVLESAWGNVASHLLLAHGLPATLAERRVLGFTPRGLGKQLTQPRVKMFRSTLLDADDIDYLYSELTLVSW